MFRKILFLMISGMLAVTAPSLLWAESRAVEPLAAASPISEVGAPAASKPAISPDNEGYFIGPGDVLDIAVWKDEALTRSCVVRPDGGISFPLIGDVQAGNRTASQVKAEIEKRLERYVPGTVLSLEIKQVNSMIIYVVGKVNAPGRFIMNTNVDVLQAIASAGGLNVYAKRGRIKIFRSENNKTSLLPFDYDDVVDGKHIEQNIRLKRGDVVVVP